MTRAGAIRLVLQSKGRLCLRVHRDPAGDVITRSVGQKLHAISRRTSRIAAGAFTAVMSVSSAAYAQSSGTPVPDEERPVAEQALKTKANGFSGWLIGTIMDPNGAAIPGAQVTLTNEQTNEVQVLQANENGEFRFWVSGDFSYSLLAEADGFAYSKTEAVSIGSTTETRRDVELSIASGNIIVSGGGSVVYLQPLVIAASEDDLKEIKRLLRSGENVNQAEDDGITALDLAVARGNLKIARRLISAGALVNVGGRSGETPVFWLSDENGAKMLALLVSAGANLNVANEEGETALMQASRYGEAALIQALVDAGGLVNLQNHHGDTALIQAARNGNEEAVRVLLAAGAIYGLRNAEGQDALQLAEANDNDEVIDLLVAAGAVSMKKPDPDDN